MGVVEIKIVLVICQVDNVNSNTMSNVPQQGVAAVLISPQLIAPHTHARTPSTRASAGRPKASWLLPARQNKRQNLNGLAPNLCINLRPTASTNPACSYAPEPSQLAFNGISSVSISAAIAGCRPPTERVGKRKAEDEALPRNKEPRLASKDRAEAMFIDIEESSELMRKSVANRALAQVKNRRVTVDSGATREIDRPKRAKRAATAAQSDNDNGVFFIFSGSMRVRRAVRHCHCLPGFCFSPKRLGNAARARARQLEPTWRFLLAYPGCHVAILISHTLTSVQSSRRLLVI